MSLYGLQCNAGTNNHVPIILPQIWRLQTLWHLIIRVQVIIALPRLLQEEPLRPVQKLDWHQTGIKLRTASEQSSTKVTMALVVFPKASHISLHSGYLHLPPVCLGISLKNSIICQPKLYTLSYGLTKDNID